MTQNPDLFVRASLPAGHFTVTAETARRGRFRVLKQPAFDKFGQPRPPKLRVDLVAATPESEAAAPDDTKE